MKRLAAGAAGIPLALLTVLGACLAGVASSSSPSGGAEPSPAAVADIPAAYLALYRQAATTCPGMAWTLLAAVGKVETNHGRSPLPGVHSGENSAGAGGPMQFLAATWAAYGRDGNSDGRIDRYHPADAIAGPPTTCAPTVAGQARRVGDAPCGPTTTPAPTKPTSKPGSSATPEPRHPSQLTLPPPPTAGPSSWPQWPASPSTPASPESSAP